MSDIKEEQLISNATIYLDCPQIYISLDGAVYHRHFHFLYFDDKNNKWNTQLFTQPITCTIDKNKVKKYIDKVLIINALPKKYFNEKSIKNSINIPYTTSLKNIDKIMKEKLGKLNNHQKQLPIIVYCYSIFG